MSRGALRCMVEIQLHSITCPGTWLSRRDDVYLSVEMFNSSRTTQLTSPVFPLLFHEKFRFDKVFYAAFEPSQVAFALEDCYVLVELVQLSAVYESGRVLASYESNARDFLYPYPSRSSTYGTDDREVFMDAAYDFPGIAPKLLFSTKTVLRDTARPSLDYYEDLAASGRPSYARPLRSSLRRRSLSPGLSGSLGQLWTTDDDFVDKRPPFVVRKAGEELIGRVPTALGARPRLRRIRRSRSVAGLYNRSYDDDYLDSTWSYGPRDNWARQAAPQQQQHFGARTQRSIADRVDLAIRRNRLTSSYVPQYSGDYNSRRYLY